MKYLDQRYKDETWDQIPKGASEIVSDFIEYQSYYGPKPGIEARLERLVEMVGRIADAANIDMTKIVESHEVDGKYVVADPD